jgi:hypothetical protein
MKELLIKTILTIIGIVLPRLLLKWLYARGFTPGNIWAFIQDFDIRTFIWRRPVSFRDRHRQPAPQIELSTLIRAANQQQVLLPIPNDINNEPPSSFPATTHLQTPSENPSAPTDTAPLNPVSLYPLSSIPGVVKAYHQLP